MDPYLSLAQTLAVALGIGLLSGINLYVVVLVLGFVGIFTDLPLPHSLVLLQHPAVIAAALVMYLVNFIAEKIPSFDARWDLVQGVVKVLGAAILTVGMLGPHEPWLGAISCAAGGSLAAFAHLVCRCWRLLLPSRYFSFLAYSITTLEDVVVAVGTWTAVAYPVQFLPIGVVVLAIVIVFLMRFQELPKRFIVVSKEQCRPRRKKDENDAAKHVKKAKRQLSSKEEVVTLARLWELRMAGALNEEEFEQQKRQIISQP